MKKIHLTKPQHDALLDLFDGRTKRYEGRKHATYNVLKRQGLVLFRSWNKVQITPIGKLAAERSAECLWWPGRTRATFYIEEN